MRSRRERVHDLGEQVLRETGTLHPDVDIRGGKIRQSHNALIPSESGDGTVVLVNGPAWPLLSMFDGTASMGENVGRAHTAAGAVDAMLGNIRGLGFNTQLAAGVVQDVGDHYPVVQMTQYESDNRRAEQLRLLLPANAGGDAPEDYDLALAHLMLGLDLDIWRYGLRGYAFIVGDQLGRGFVTPSDVRHHLGHTIQSQMTTEAICKALRPKLHLFFLQVDSRGPGGYNSISHWWLEKLGLGRVIITPHQFLAEVQAGLAYVTETLRPTQDGLSRFLQVEGANTTLSQRNIHEIWQCLQAAQEHFGSQARLTGYNDLPKPGDVFVHYRDPWPIGHPRFSENPSQGGSPSLPNPVTDAPTDESTGGGIDWGRF
jgi:hypothetical protein